MGKGNEQDGAGCMLLILVAIVLIIVAIEGKKNDSPPKVDSVDEHQQSRKQ